MSRTADLAEVLEGLGVDVFKTHGDEINARCPVHEKYKGRESTRNSWYMNVDSGLWHCFTCGARGNLSMLVSELSADPSVLWQVQSHLITQGLRRLTAEEAVYDDNVTEAIDWNTLAQFAPLPDAVVKLRNLDPDMARRFGVRWDKEKKAAVLPIVSPLGELRGWQLKKSGWVRNHPEGVNKSTTLFGVERAYGTTGLLVESPLDVVRFHSVYDGSDINCVSSFGANVSDEQIQITTMKFDKLIIAMDNDNAGRTESARLKRILPSPRKGLWFWKYDTKDKDSPLYVKDIGEMTDGQIIRGLQNVNKGY